MKIKQKGRGRGEQERNLKFNYTFNFKLSPVSLRGRKMCFKNKNEKTFERVDVSFSLRVYIHKLLYRSGRRVGRICCGNDPQGKGPGHIARLNLNDITMSLQ